MSVASRYRVQAAKMHSVADKLSAKSNCTIFERIARRRAATFAKRADTASRWETMAKTPLDERPGGFPGDPFNNRLKVQNG
jgi:hypothetical protein